MILITISRMIPLRKALSMSKSHWLTRLALGTTISLIATGALALGSGAATSHGATGVIHAGGAENEYADVLSQIGGKYISVSSILNNPNTDPHTYEASTSVARAVSQAQLVVQNGVGYDRFMNTIE